MKVKSKRVIVSLVTMVLSLSALPMDAFAQTNKQQPSPVTINSVTEPYAQIIDWRYKTENGKLYRRLYNYSRQQWIGEWELC